MILMCKELWAIPGSLIVFPDLFFSMLPSVNEFGRCGVRSPKEKQALSPVFLGRGLF
jgi:hypothetical protein